MQVERSINRQRLCSSSKPESSNSSTDNPDLELLGARPSNSRKITQPPGRMTYENRPLTASSQHALDYVTSALRRILTSDNLASLSGVRLVTRLLQQAP